MSDGTSVVKSKEARLARLDEIEDSLKEESFAVVDAVVNFADIDRDEEVVPEQWIDLLGYARAVKRFRLAKAAWLGAKEAPIGIKVAASIAGNIIKSRGNDGNKQPLNLTLVKVTNTLPTYDAIEVEE